MTLCFLTEKDAVLPDHWIYRTSGLARPLVLPDLWSCRIFGLAGPWEERGHFILVFDVMRGGFDGGDYFVVSVYTRRVGECQVS